MKPSRHVSSAALALALLGCRALGCGGASPAPSEPTTPNVQDRGPLRDAVAEVHAAFDEEAALATVRYTDGFFRVRGNEGYEATLARVRDTLEGCGLDAVEGRAVGEAAPTWTPRSAQLFLLDDQGGTPLIVFDDESQRGRATLLVRSDPVAPSTDLEVIRAEAVEEGASADGRVILTEGNPRRLYADAHARGARGLLTRWLEPYHRPDEQLDAAQFGYLPPHAGDDAFFGFSLSERAWRRLRAATESGPARVRVSIDVAIGHGAPTLVEGRIDGDDPDAGAVVFVAHADEPGANDNGSGVGALTELACALARVERARRRSFVFLFGAEMEIARAWLDAPSVPPAAGLVMDMVGEDPEIVGAPFLVERMPDPGAIWLRPPDEHSEWGQSEVREDQLVGHFLNDLVLAAAAQIEDVEGERFRYASNPFEGGSDHVPFLERGLPAVLGWHFTDSAYHTTLDRMDRVSGPEMRRVAACLGGAALLMADGAEAAGRATLAIVEAAARERLEHVLTAAADQVTIGGDAPLEARIVDAWVTWYDAALGSVGAWWPEIRSEVQAARDRWRSAAERMQAGE